MLEVRAICDFADVRQNQGLIIFWVFVGHNRKGGVEMLKKITLGVMVAPVGFFIAVVSVMTISGESLNSAFAMTERQPVSVGPVWSHSTGQTLLSRNLPGETTIRQELISDEYQSIIEVINDRFKENWSVIYLPDSDSRIQREETRVLVNTPNKHGVFDRTFPAGTTPEQIARAIAEFEG